MKSKPAIQLKAIILPDLSPPSRMPTITARVKLPRRNSSATNRTTHGSKPGSRTQASFECHGRLDAGWKLAVLDHAGRLAASHRVDPYRPYLSVQSRR